MSDPDFKNDDPYAQRRRDWLVSAFASNCNRPVMNGLWGSLVSCSRLSIGQLPRWRRTAAEANRRLSAEQNHFIGAYSGHRLPFRIHFDGMGSAGFHRSEHVAIAAIYFHNPAFTAVRDIAGLRADP